MDDLTNNEAMPEVQPHAMKAVQDEKQEVISEAIDNGFNPEIHETNAQGEPVLTKTGNFRKKRGAGAATRKTKSKLDLSEKKPENAEDKSQKVTVESKTAAITTSAILERVQIGVIGDDMVYDDTERAANVEAWFNLYEYYGGVEVHPAMAVAADHTMLILSRAQKPTVKSKFKKLSETIAGKIALMRGKNAFFNSRKNTKRENNVRQEEGGEPEKTGNENISS